MTYLSAIFNWIKGNQTLSILIAAGLFIAGQQALMMVKDHQHQEETIALSDSLAAHDHLRVILQNEYGKLSGRFAFLQDDLNAKASENKTLKAYLKASNAKVEALSRTLSEVRIENQTLLGKLEKDSTGQEYASFDTTAMFYSMSLDVWLHPSPILRLNSLYVPDSTTVAFLDEGTSIRGVINHSNPYISDRGGEFYRTFNPPQIKEGTNVFPYILGGGVGLVVGWLLHSVIK